MEKQPLNFNPLKWIPTTWFAMGLPFVVLSTASTIMYKNLGISDTIIAFWTSLMMLPWTLKPLWGPFLEMFRSKKYFVYVSQIFTGCIFGLVALSLKLENFFSVTITLFTIIAISASTHDTAADGIYLNELDSKQQAKYVGWQGAFYNIAKIISGGLLVYLAGELEKKHGIINAWVTVMLLYSLIMVILGIYNMKKLPNGVESKQVGDIKEGFGVLKEVIITFFQKKNIWYSLAFIVFYRFAEGQAIKITPLFFKATREQGGLGLSTSQIGVLYGIFGAASFVIGSFVAGYFVSKNGRLNRKTLMILCCFFNLPFAAYAFLAITLPVNLNVIAAAVAIEYFGYGFGFVGLVLYIMQQIAPGKYKMAHYAFGSGLTNLGFMLPSMISGFVSDRLGYEYFFIWVLISTIPAFIISWVVPLPNVDQENSKI
jgi:PAT family beta-lactamase induction signal transducer AmpG